MVSRKPPGKVPTPFGVLVQRYLGRNELTLRAYAELLGVSNVYVNNVIYGVRPPNLDQLNSWIPPLGLTDAEEEEFTTEAIIATCNEQTRTLIRGLQRRLAKKD